MDLKNAECIWDALNDLHKNDKQAYEKFMNKHMKKINEHKVIKPKFCFCIVTDVEKVSIKTKSNEFKEKLCDYFIYVYYSSKMKEPILPKDFINNLDEINYDYIFISTCKIKGESSRDMYAEAVIHSTIYKHFHNTYFKNKILYKILETLNNTEKILRSDISINTKFFQYKDLGYTPKTKHFLNSHCVDSELGQGNIEPMDENDIKFYNIVNEKQINSNNKREEEQNEIKIHDSSIDIMNDIQSVKTTKTGKVDRCEERNIPRQVKSYHYTVIDRYLHIILTFNSISYNDLEILKKNNTIEIYVSTKPDECMTLNFKQKLSDNIKAYFNEKCLKLTISVELLY
ncbi:hypothetical protein, conserved [Plasmodium gonderi]|uniref:PIH1 N-terminal domain-containing protein n=1 Tax=Plasmodium gonderi TaxID=77519 RepID=A0A1Y1JI99_PLAGO|nr:hypothetical protein, conserved [Plasmodium gonderi]GAW80532.1 hypothetical protein, conserved [Plasmodium gonderi]